MSKNKKLTVDDVLKQGARISIYFHWCGDLQKAYDKLKPYKSLGDIKKDQAEDGTTWLKVVSEDQNIEVTAFL